MSGPGRGVPGRFPPAEIAEVKALACELPAESGRALSRWSAAELAREAVARGIVCEVSGTTVWRWLSEDAIRPWAWRSWVFPRDPDFREKAGRVLDLYERRWRGPAAAPRRLRHQRRREDPAPSAAAGVTRSSRRHPGGPGWSSTSTAAAGRWPIWPRWTSTIPQRGLFGHCEAKISNDAFDALVAEVMTTEPYASARRVFLVVDNGTIHRGQKAIDRLQDRWPNLVLVHLPRHASWLNPIEIYFSIVSRKALTPAHFNDTDEVAERVLGFQAEFRQTAAPFDWTFTRRDLNALLDRLDQRGRLAPAA